MDSGWVTIDTFSNNAAALLQGRLHGTATRINANQVRFIMYLQFRITGTASSYNYAVNGGITSSGYIIMSNRQIKPPTSGYIRDNVYETSMDLTLDMPPTQTNIQFDCFMSAPGSMDTKYFSAVAWFSAGVVAPSVPIMGEVTNITDTTAQFTISVPSWGIPASGHFVYFINEVVERRYPATGSISTTGDVTITLTGLTPSSSYNVGHIGVINDGGASNSLEIVKVFNTADLPVIPPDNAPVIGLDGSSTNVDIVVIEPSGTQVPVSIRGISPI